MDVSGDEDWLRCFGVLPQTHGASDEEWIRELRLGASNAEQVLLTWDVLGESVRLTYSVGSRRPLVEVVRERVRSLTGDRHGTVATVAVEWGNGSLAGRTVATIAPAFHLADTMLRTA